MSGTVSASAAERLRETLAAYDAVVTSPVDVVSDSAADAAALLVEAARSLLDEVEGPALAIPVASPSGTYGPWLVMANYTHTGDKWTSSGQLPALIVPSWLGLRAEGVEPYMRRLVNPTEDERLTVHVGHPSGDVDHV